MSSQQPVASGRVPVIDLTDHLAGRPGAEEAAAAELGRARREVGFFSSVGHGVDWDEVEAIYDLAARYHRLPEAAM
ncbi:MAG: 2-oxoglutarate and iron-dependent oxygenase domain-containing protein, partial [Acidimicrobiia bacterium]